MKEVRIWEVSREGELIKMRATSIDFEERLEGWLEKDISVLDQDLLVIGRQVSTSMGGKIDLLCLDSAGETVVIELKKGQTPRDVTAQTLDYASCVQGLTDEELRDIAERYLGSAGSLRDAFERKFDRPIPEELNLGHRSLIVATSVDASTERIVRYLSELDVPINVVTIHHFEDSGGREMLARVYLIEPGEAEARSRSTSRRRQSRSLSGLQALAIENGVGKLYAQVREGVRGILSASAVARESVGYTIRDNAGSMRTVLLVRAYADDNGGLPFVVHATRIGKLMGVDMQELSGWLPDDAVKRSVSNWVGSSDEERQGAAGMAGVFRDSDQVDQFMKGLRSWMARQRMTSGGE